jgi:glycosyltransferase involved in cell wall biosynthesis
MKQTKILMLGESLSKQGGIVSVQKLTLDHIPASVQIQHIATLVDGSSLQKTLGFGKAVFELIQRLRTEEIDLIHIHMSERGSAFRQGITTLVGSLFGTPVIMHAHGPEFHLFYGQLPAWIQQMLGWVYRHCDHFIVLSDSWKTFYTQSLKLKTERVTVLPNAVKIPPQPVPHRSHGPVHLVFFGRIGQRKGAFDLVKAFAALPTERQCQAKITMAGDGEVEQLRQLIKNLNLEKAISVLGWVSSEQRDQILEQADVFVLPSYNEALPMALLEAMGWGLPVITTPVGGIPELINAQTGAQQNGLLVEPGAIGQLTAAIDLLIRDRALRVALGGAARATVLPFDVERYCDALSHIYCAVLSKKREFNYENTNI